MPGETQISLGAAQDALEAGNWSAAKASFEAALREQETAEALYGLGTALWWLGETEDAVSAVKGAYVQFRRRPDPTRAALAAIFLCVLHGASLGNFAGMRGWLGRLARLVDEFELDDLKGWVLLCRAATANDTGDPYHAERWAREAREVARRSADADLELCALSEIGAALVEMGRWEEGCALLDEAMAGALGGEGENLDTVVFAGCRTIVCCSRAADFARAAQWIRAADEFTRRYGSPHLYTVCRIHYANLQFAAGRWSEAEKELRAALHVGRTAEPALHAEALAKLAELRLAQGRIEEAAQLLAGFEDQLVSAYALGAIHLARGEPGVASALLRRRLRECGEDCAQGAGLLELLAEAEIAQGDLDTAVMRARRLLELGENGSGDLVRTRGERALGRALAAADDRAGAVLHLERALEGFARLEMPLEAGRTRLELTEALVDEEREAAVAEARKALATFEELGAAGDADRAAAFLRSLGVRVARSGPRGNGVLTKRELEVLGLLAEGLSNRQIAERLFLTRKTVEHHVRSVLSKLDLDNRSEAAAYAVRHLERDSATS